MATLKLNIYKNQKEIEKTLEAESYDLMFGTVEDLLQIFDVDSLTDNVKIAEMVATCFNELKPLLMDIFPELTDDDTRRIKIKELIPLFIDVCGNIADDFKYLTQGNLKRA
jgi:hypothetical protein